MTVHFNRQFQHLLVIAVAGEGKEKESAGILLLMMTGYESYRRRGACSVGGICCRRSVFIDLHDGHRRCPVIAAAAGA